MGVEQACFSPAHRDPALRASLLADCGLPESAALLLAVGRLAPEKRWPLVIDAVSLASQQTPIGLVMLGEGREQRAILRHIAGNPHVRLFAPERNRSAFARIMASADALVHGCEAETFCMTAAEARASGTPVVVPDAGGAADHAADGAGRTYTAADSNAAAEAILEVVRERPRPRASARTMDEHFRELFSAYAACLERRRQAARKAFAVVTSNDDAGDYRPGRRRAPYSAFCQPPPSARNTAIWSSTSAAWAAA
jgi:alpha-1,6-mannosyltransferase